MILVSGATGKVGSEVVRGLAARGVPVRALVRNLEKASAIEGANVQVVRGDLSEPKSLRMAADGAEKVFVASSGDLRQVELQGNLVAAAQTAGARHIIKLSTLGASGDSPVPIHRWHRETELQVEETGIPFTHLRPHHFMQNMLAFAASITASGSFSAPMADGRIAMIDARDIAAVAVAALTEGGHECAAYDITGPEALSFDEAAAAISEAVGKPVVFVDISLDEAREQLLAVGLPEWRVEILVKLYERFRSGSASAVTNVVEEVAKRRPRTFRDFARDFADTFKGAPS